MDSGSRQRNSGVPEFRQYMTGASRKHPTCARGSAGMTANSHQVDHQRIGAIAALERGQALGRIGVVERFEDVLTLVFGALLERAAPAFVEGLLHIGLQMGRAVGELTGDLGNVGGELVVAVPAIA